MQGYITPPRFREFDRSGLLSRISLKCCAELASHVPYAQTLSPSHFETLPLASRHQGTRLDACLSTADVQLYTFRSGSGYFSSGYSR